MQEYSPNRGEKGAKRTPQNRGERAGKRNEYGESLDLGNDPRNQHDRVRSPPRRSRRPRQDEEPIDGPGGSGNYSYAGNDGSLSPDALLRAMSHARQNGERLGKWSAEFDDMKRRLKQVEAREDATREFRAQAENGSGSKGVRAGGVGVRTSMMDWTTAAWKMRPRITLTTPTWAIPMQTCLCTTAQKVLFESAAPQVGKAKGRQDASIDLEHDGKDGQRARESRDRYDEENNLRSSNSRHSSRSVHNEKRQNGRAQALNRGGPKFSIEGKLAPRFPSEHTRRRGRSTAGPDSVIYVQAIVVNALIEVPAGSPAQ